MILIMKLVAAELRMFISSNIYIWLCTLVSSPISGYLLSENAELSASIDAHSFSAQERLPTAVMRAVGEWF